MRLLYRVYKVRKTESTKDVEKLKKFTLNSGPIAIKFIQFMASNEALFSSNISSQISDVFENCTIHDVKYTEDAYMKDFGKDIHTDYNFDGTVHSGSIGQVYRAYSKVRETYVAIKVKHPKIDNEVKKFIQCLSVSISIIKLFYNIPYVYLILEFIHNIQMQLNFEQEANNMKKLKKCYEDTPCIVIPDVFEVSSQIIIMSFHEGLNINYIKDKKIKLKISLYLNLFVTSSILLHNFLHCDLHCGNWKVDISSKDNPKLIIYDCGIFAETDNISKNKNIIGYLLDSNFSELIKMCSDQSDEIARLQDDIKKIESDKKMDASKKLNMFLKIILESSIKADYSIVRLIQGLAITGTNVTYSVDTLTGTFVDDRNNDKTLLLFAYMCVCYNSENFVQLYEFYRAWIDENQAQSEFFMEWLQKKYGHQDTEIFYETLCDIFNLKYRPLNYPDVFLA